MVQEGSLVRVVVLLCVVSVTVVLSCLVGGARADTCPDNEHSCSSASKLACCCNTTVRPEVCGCMRDDWSCCGVTGKGNDTRVYSCPKKYPWCRVIPGIPGWSCFVNAVDDQLTVPADVTPGNKPHYVLSVNQ
eukprot:TRINITY_DN1417_c0_g1_i2.p1 TRINITY_DN1417_c0_g1~~TRINITY_DN1417_c0_g1_i2.p1  ORF type:complete len:133 (+),score=16.11 TRINITY_DN1417_c0_g1_i2:12-410(+)